MTDLTAPLNELRAAYRAYQNAKRDKKEEVTEKYRARMEDEIRSLVNAEKYAFAKRLKDTKDYYDLTVSDIQDHVLRTRNWKVWEDIRDFADIPPESVVRQNAKEAKRLANAVGVWSEDYSTLTVSKNTRGEVLDPPVVYDSKTLYRVHSNWWAYAVEQANDADDVRARKADPALAAALTAEFQRAIDEGHIENPDLRKR